MISRRGAHVGLAMAGVAAGALAWMGLLVWRGPEPGGIEDAWVALLGPADLGPIDASRSGVLACPSGHCPGGRSPDLPTPVYPVPGVRLRALTAQAAAEEPDTERIFEARWAEEDRYLSRTPLLRIPSTVNVAVIGAGEGRAMLVLHARSQFGSLATDGERTRLRRWLARIEALTAAEAGP